MRWLDRFLRKKSGIVFAAVFIFALLLVREKMPKTVEPSPPALAPALATKSAASISKFAFSTYTEKDFPRLFQKWGPSGVAQIEEMERKVAAHVALATACDRIELVQLSEFRSYPPADFVVFVDCANGNRFYVGQKELQLPPERLTYKKV